ncbi:hypothetical protein J7L81_04240 [Candidatus Aerophobetes bacterium]|nr:hypothetical protein [Candidatus Aerophobetes bacterium]
MIIESVRNDFTFSSVNPTPLGKDTFFQLLVMELTHQDPMEPMSNRDFVTQLAQFSSLEKLNNISEGIDSMLKAQILYQAGQMLGFNVEGYDPSTNGQVEGKVKEVCWKDGTCYLMVGEKYIPFSCITKIFSQ